jgi:hypothetical protein
MQEKARIQAIDGRRVTVVPLDLEACIGCKNAQCKSNGNRFEAVNSRGLDLRVGDEVRIGASAGAQARQALLSVGLPAGVGIIAYLTFGALFPVSEGLRVALSLGGVLASALIRLRLIGPSGAALSEVLEVVEG